MRLHIHKLLYNLAHDTLGHFRFDKSYKSLWGSYYWPNMCHNLKNAYIPSCAECQWNKSCTSKPTGSLHPLPVPNDCFDIVALDFIRLLPEEHADVVVLIREAEKYGCTRVDNESNEGKNIGRDTSERQSIHNG